MADSKGKAPTHNVYAQGEGQNAPLREIGAAWEHASGGGFNIELTATPTNGRVVVFPRKEKDSDK